MPNKMKTETINADGLTIRVYTKDFENDFISLSDIAKKREGEYPGYVIQNWMRSKSTVSFLGLWETIHNPGFNYLEFEAIKSEAGDNGFVMTPKRWIESTNAKVIGKRINENGKLVPVRKTTKYKKLESLEPLTFQAESVNNSV